MSELAAPRPDRRRSGCEIARQRFREEADGTVVDRLRPGDRDRVGADADARRIGGTTSGRLRDIPTLVVRGETSDVLARATVDEMRARKPDLQSVEIAGRGHCPIPHEPECLAAITWFVTSLPG